MPETKVCRKAISAEYGNTSNLRKHIQSKHKSTFAELSKLSPRASKRTQPLQDGETAEQPSTSKNRFLHERCKWHDAKNISDELCSCLEEWIPGYEEKLVKIYAVSDNAANVKPAMHATPQFQVIVLLCTYTAIRSE